MSLRRLSLTLAAVVAALVPLGTSVATAAPSSFAGRFIVTLTDDASSPAVAAEYRRNGAAVDHVYTAALNGFAGSMSDGNVQALRSDHRVVRIERDGIATASDVQTGATWGLDRIDQTNRPVDGSYTYTSTGAGVTAYIVDTGINTAHTEFGGRASFPFDAIGGFTDCNGHGTHVAGTVGGATWGVAKAVNLVAVRVLGCNGSGSWSGVIAGLDWIVANHAAGAPAVANMSLGGGASTAVDDAVRRVIADGVTMAVAAGNGNSAGVAQNTCNYSPARVTTAITVGSTTSTDAKSSWSNYGSCVDLFAPGSSISSAWIGSTTATNTISGTSMATPHVAGVAALYLQTAGAVAPSTVASALASATTKSIVTSSSTANNHLLCSYVPSGCVRPGTISGIVTAAGGGGISGALVTASGVSTTAAPDGSYGMSLPAGTHTVSVSADGFVTATSSVTVLASQNTVADVALQPVPPPSDANLQLTVTVGAKKKNGTTPVTASWTDNASGLSYAVYTDGVLRTTTSGFSYSTNVRGPDIVTFRVCRSGTTTCVETDAQIL